MQRFEYCNVKTCAAEMLALGQESMKMWYIFKWLTEHDELRHGTQAELIKLYVGQELVAYSMFENYEACADKIVQHQGVTYQDLGVVHFVTVNKHRNKGYASLLADVLYDDVISPLLARYVDVRAYITVTGRAVSLMQRTPIKPVNMIKQFYSEVTFEEKVVKYLNTHV